MKSDWSVPEAMLALQLVICVATLTFSWFYNAKTKSRDKQMELLKLESRKADHRIVQNIAIIAAILLLLLGLLGTVNLLAK